MTKAQINNKYVLGNKVEILNYRNKQLESTIDSYNKGTKPNETIIPMKRLRTANDVIRINGTKNIQARGNCVITGRTIPIDQLSSVII